MSDFHRDILFDILLRLPPHKLIQSMCVSKAWFDLIHDPHFIKAHLQRSIETNSSRTILLTRLDGDLPPSDLFSFPFDDNGMIGKSVKIEQPLVDPDRFTSILGYSNGLVCIRNYHSSTREYDIAFWNPSIQKFKKMPSPTTEETPQSYTYHKYWYDLPNGEYKLVALVGMENSVSQVKVYSLHSNSWKIIQNIPCNCNALKRGSYGLVVLNGALNWLVGEEIDNRYQYKILALNLADEKYRYFPTPVNTPVDDDYNSDVNLNVWGGCLCIAVNRCELRKDVWVMKEYGLTDSWTLLYSIELSAPISVDEDGEDSLYVVEDCVPLVCSKNGEMVLLWVENTRDRNRLFWYDIEKKSAQQVELSGLDIPFGFEVTICWGSLCLLDGNPVIAEEQP